MSIETRNGAYEFVQASPSTSWVITHKLGITTPVVDCWVDINGTMTKILPQTVTATSNSVVTITFSVAYAGRALVA